MIEQQSPKDKLEFGDWEYLEVFHNREDNSVNFQAGLGHDSGSVNLTGDDLRAVRDLINRALEDNDQDD